MNGSATLDKCGACDDDPENDCVQDCAGTWGGSATLDECGTCDDDPENDCVLHCMNSERDEDEWGIDCGGEECPPCVPCNDTLPYNSMFSVVVDVTITRFARPECNATDTHSVVERVLEFGDTGEDLTIDGNVIADYEDFSVVEDDSRVRFRYGNGSEPYWGACELLGAWFDTPYGVNWELTITVDRTTGQIEARESCYDYEGHCLNRWDWGYENGTGQGRGYNVCP